MPPLPLLPLPLLLFVLICLLSASHAAPVVWIGAVTANSFSIHLDVPSNVSQIVLAPISNFSKIAQTIQLTDDSAKIAASDVYGQLKRFSFDSLKPSTVYHVGLRSARTTKHAASVRTFPARGDSGDVILALSSCQSGAENDAAFHDIRKWYDDQQEPSSFLMLHMGDMAYADIAEDDVASFEQSLRQVLQRDRVHSVFSRMPVAYMYDDHDFGQNDAAFSSVSRPAALSNYRDMVPSYKLSSRDASYHAFTVGRVRIILSDTRALADRDKGSTLGISQRQWLFRELANATKYDVMVWMTSKPWIGGKEEGKDSWAGYADERRLISERLAALNVTNLVAVAGDAHMLAADNGYNTDYSEKGGGFPMFQAAPLSNRGSSKGGPYSQGCSAFKLYRNEQYGILRITRVGKKDGPCVEFLGYRAGYVNEPVIQFKKCGRLSGVTGRGGQESKCDLATFPTWVSVVIILSVAWLLLTIVVTGVICASCLCRRRGKKIEKDKTVTTDETDD